MAKKQVNNLTTQQIIDKKLPLNKLLEVIKTAEDTRRKATVSVLKHLFVIFYDQNRLIDTKNPEFFDGRMDKFSFSKWLVKVRKYTPVTASEYTGVLTLIKDHNAISVLDKHPDTWILKQIRTCPDFEVQKRLLEDMDNLSRENFTVMKDKLLLGPTKDLVVPYLRAIPGFLNIKKKLIKHKTKHRLIVEGKDRVYIDKLDQIIDAMSPEIVDELYERLRTQSLV